MLCDLNGPTGRNLLPPSYKIPKFSILLSPGLIRAEAKLLKKSSISKILNSQRGPNWGHINNQTYYIFPFKLIQSLELNLSQVNKSKPKNQIKLWLLNSYKCIKIKSNGY